MVQRTPPQYKTDDAAFPVRLYIVVPGDGLGKLMDVIYDRLVRELGRGEFAWHSGGAYGAQNRAAIYFRHPAAAAALLEAIPEIKIADGTMASTYSSPTFPFGRRRDGE
ncbi:hypothetical protein [Neogemmobacter tilapiae]|uniref:Uncharacterized protein n=1 Tax=Neogemmobacter tilapiae TaxID=875041 RepID=A0A918TX07_9RHOB|nr:hypothetical protein [Gemmobacter tilapiae]GHC65652.1 hypothetical protein GCM10007315_32710 [Gemmobacter tilapiae]